METIDFVHEHHRFSVNFTYYDVDPKEFLREAHQVEKYKFLLKWHTQRAYCLCPVAKLVGEHLVMLAEEYLTDPSCSNLHKGIIVLKYAPSILELE